MRKIKRTVAGICAVALAVSNLMGMAVFAADENDTKTTGTDTAVTTSVDTAKPSYFTIAAKWIGDNLRIAWNKVDGATEYKVSIKDTSVEDSKWESYKSVKGIGCYLTDLQENHTYSICIMAISNDGESYKCITSRIITVLRDRTIEGAVDGLTVIQSADDKTDTSKTDTSKTDTDNKEDNKENTDTSKTENTDNKDNAENKDDKDNTEDKDDKDDKDNTEDKQPEVANNNFKYNSGATYKVCDVNYVTKYAKSDKVLVEITDEHGMFENPIFIPNNMDIVEVNERNGVSANDNFAVKNYLRLNYNGSNDTFEAVKSALVEKGVSFLALTSSDEDYKMFAAELEKVGKAANVDFAYKGTYKGITVVLCKSSDGFVTIEYRENGSAKAVDAVKSTLEVAKFTDVYNTANNVVMPSNVPCLAMYNMYSTLAEKNRHISGTFAVTAEQAKAYLTELEKAGYIPTSAVDFTKMDWNTSYYNTSKMTIYVQYKGKTADTGYLIITAEHKR